MKIYRVTHHYLSIRNNNYNNIYFSNFFFFQYYTQIGYSVTLITFNGRKIQYFNVYASISLIS